MKTKFPFAALVLAFAALNAQRSTTFAQGTLTPPGAPAPTMKTLDQIEARTPISSVPFTISASGSYYLTTNLTVSSGDAITIAANGVTLDLNGFTIASTAANPAGIAITTLIAVTNVAIYNGNISSGVTNNNAGVFWGVGFASGIRGGNILNNFRVKNVSVAGVLGYGIFLGTDNSTVVEGCTVNESGGYGIYADSVTDSTAVNCGSYGIYAGTAQNCKGTGVGEGDGLYVNIANNCYGYSSGSGIGLYADRAATGCYGSSASGRGLQTSTANNCYGSSYGGGTGLYASAVATGCIGNSASGTGLYATTANNCDGASSGSGTGLYASNVAIGCYGFSSGSGYGLYASVVATGCFGHSASGTGLFAFIASVCHGDSTSGTALSVTHNVNSF